MKCCLSYMSYFPQGLVEHTSLYSEVFVCCVDFRTCHIFYECYSSTPRVKVKISWNVVFRTCHIFVGSYYLKIMMMFVLPSTVHLHSYVEYDLLICRHWQLNGGLFCRHWQLNGGLFCRHWQLNGGLFCRHWQMNGVLIRYHQGYNVSR
jgi:hypothetical protein